MRTLRLFPMALAVALAGFGCSPSSNQEERPAGAGEMSAAADSGATPSSDRARYEVDVNPGDFVEEIDNPYFPLVPGTVFRLRGVTTEGVENETIKVTDRTKTVMGVRTTVVKDVMRTNDEISELTSDWYAQDREGNVWYFGEDTAEYENGRLLNRHGAWEAGVDGALPGIIMNANPQVTDSHRQEYYEGEAEDMFWVVSTGGSEKVPFGQFEDVVTTLEWTPLEPNIVVEKRYAPGIGLLSERALSGGKENVRLLEVSEP
jgi:hypothetical protein